jgi:lipopolysaccharide export system permease protein
MPKILPRYLIKQNLFYLAVIFGAGVAIFILVDLFDRLDDFLDAGLGMRTVALYFAYKVPSMVSQIAPAVFLLAVLIQLGLMRKSRELTALAACAIPYSRLVRIFVGYGLICCLVQLLFSQFVGVVGFRESRRIWDEQVRGRQVDGRTLAHVWFREGDRVVHLNRVTPDAGTGTGITIHTLTPDSTSLETVIRADRFQAANGTWTLKQGEITAPHRFETTGFATHRLDMETDPGDFLVIDPKIKLQSLPAWQLQTMIERLEQSGSNVERLKAALHMKIAYGFSIVVMALIALALATRFENIYVLVPLGLLLVFVYYTAFVLGVTAGEKNLLPPALGPWMANLVFGVGAGVKIGFKF